MRIPKLIIPALALASAWSVNAAEPAADSTQQQLEALKARVAELERKQVVVPAGKSLVAPGMTPDQETEFNRIKIKTEAMEDSRDANGFKGLKISGYADPVYLYNRNKDRGGFQFLVPASREPYAYDNSYFGTFALDLVKETDSGTRFRFTLSPARSIGDFVGGANIVHEATVWVPVGSGTKLFVGQVPDWSGYEMLQPTLNKLITHNLLFDMTLPYEYTGAGLDFLVGKYDLKFMIANFNQPIRDLGQSKPAFVFRGDYTGGEFWGIGWAGAAGWKPNLRAVVAGSETNPTTGMPYDANDSFYGTAELDCWYTRGALSLAAHVTYGSQERAAITADPVTGKLRNSEWVGGSVLLAYKLTPRLEWAIRGDYIWNEKNGGGLLDFVEPDQLGGVGPDGNGEKPNRGANRYEGSTALSYALNPNVTLKAEYRYDGADRKVFANKAMMQDPALSTAKFVKDNHLVATSMVFSF
jgi:hypothetical protein